MNLLLKVFILKKINEKVMRKKISKRQNRFLHALKDDLKKIQPDKLELDVHGDTTPPNIGFKVDAEYIKTRKTRKLYR